MGSTSRSIFNTDKTVGFGREDDGEEKMRNRFTQNHSQTEPDVECHEDQHQQVGDDQLATQEQRVKNGESTHSGCESGTSFGADFLSPVSRQSATVIDFPEISIESDEFHQKAENHDAHRA